MPGYLDSLFIIFNHKVAKQLRELIEKMPIKSIYRDQY
jgi:hypothetical protein